MAYEDYNIKQFINAVFKKDYSEKGIPEDIVDVVYTEYVDTAQLYETEEFHKVSYIHFLNNRINSVNLAIKIERECIEVFDSPYLPGLDFFKKFGYNIKWKDNIDDILSQFIKIEIKEKKFVSQLEGKVKELIELREKKDNKERPVKLQRESFIRTLNSLGKVGFRIDNERTTVEELALMIKQQKEEIKSK